MVLQCCSGSIYLLFSLFSLYFWAPPPLLRLKHLLFLFLSLVDLLFSLYLWGPLPLSMFNICYFCVFCFLDFVIFVIFVGPPSLLPCKHLLFLFFSLVDLLLSLDLLFSLILLYFWSSLFCLCSRIVIIAAVASFICYFRYICGSSCPFPS